MKKRIVAAFLVLTLCVGLGYVAFGADRAFEGAAKQKFKQSSLVMAKEPSNEFTDAVENFEGFTAWTKNAKAMEALLLPKSGENTVVSPVNLSMALCMLAEITKGKTQQEVLDALQMKDIKEVREKVEAAFFVDYMDSKQAKCLLANSVWLREDSEYDKEKLKELAKYYYASSFFGEMGSKAYDSLYQDWLNEKTNGILKEAVKNEHFEPEMAMALASTIYYKAGWEEDKEEVYDQTFYAKDGDEKVTMLAEDGVETTYFKGESFGALSLPMRGGMQFWLFLPDKSADVKDILYDPALQKILEEGEFMESCDDVTCFDAKANVKFPTLDVSMSNDLKKTMETLGVKEAFKPEQAEFYDLMKNNPLFVSEMKQVTRLIADKEGVEAAAYTEIFEGATSCAPRERIEINFTCDRPFLYAVADSRGTVLFEGVMQK